MYNWLSPDTPARDLVDRLPTRSFYRLTSFQTLATKSPTFLYKEKGFVSKSTLELVKTVDLPFGSVKSVTSLGVHMAWLLEMPPKSECDYSFMYVAIKMKKDIDPVIVTYLSTNELVILGNSSGLLAIANTNKWIVNDARN